MLSKLTQPLSYPMSLKNKLKSKIAQILTVDAGAVLRNTPTSKQRKYKNIEITEDFKKLDEKRKKQRYENMKKRQILLQQKLKDQTKLLTKADTELIKTEIAEIQKGITDSAKEIAELNAIIDSSEAEYMVVEGFMKLAVINQIKHLEYLHTHNPGYVLHPQTIAAIENIHYCINHNLPVNRIKLYEIMPEYFQAEIGQLQQSVRKLIQEKQIFIEDEESASSIRFFHRIKSQQKQIGDYENIIQQTFDNVYEHSLRLLEPHGQLLQKVAQGKTPFRNLQHLRTVLISDLPIKYLPQEQALRKTLFEIIELEKEWSNYKKVMNQQIREMIHSYVQPPPYIANHPVLMERWDQLMQRYTKPLTMEQTPFLVEGDLSEVRLGQKMQEEIRQIVQEKYDPFFVQAMNNDRSLIDKKKLEIQFYNLSTNVLENLKALQNKFNQEQQIFKILPKQKDFLLTQRKKNLIHMNQLTRMLFLNSKDKNKYNLQFFSQWLGVDKQELRTMLKCVSYLRVPQQKEKDKEENIEFSILKFQI